MEDSPVTQAQAASEPSLQGSPTASAASWPWGTQPYSQMLRYRPRILMEKPMKKMPTHTGQRKKHSNLEAAVGCVWLKLSPSVRVTQRRKESSGLTSQHMGQACWDSLLLVLLPSLPGRQQGWASAGMCGGRVPSEAGPGCTQKPLTMPPLA